MWPSLFDDPETKASFDRLRAGGLDVAAIDGAYRKRVATGYKSLDAYAVSLGEAAKIHALAEGCPMDLAKEREREMRESIDDWAHPHEHRLSLQR